MTSTEQVEALQAFGYTSREASFMALAALHSGYFLRRQFSPKRGKLADDLCRKLVRNLHARVTVYAQSTQLFHLSAKPLYNALGEENNRHRRQQDPFSLRAKLMGLDYVLTRPELRFFPTEQAKLGHFVNERKIAPGLLPSKTYTGKNAPGRTTRFFIEKYPVWVDDRTGRVGLAYMDDGLFTPPSFPTWLRQHRALIERIGAIDVVYIALNPAVFVAATNAWKRFRSAATSVLPPEIQSYFELRSDVETRGLGGRTQDDLDRYRRLTRRFAEPRFHEQYATWKAGFGRETGAKISPQHGPGEATFSTYHLGQSYRMFGSVEGGKR